MENSAMDQLAINMKLLGYDFNINNKENINFPNLFTTNNSAYSNVGSQSNCISLNSSGFTVMDDSFPEQFSPDLLWNSNEAAGYDPNAFSTSTIRSNNANVYQTGCEEINYCPATIHLLYKDLRNTLYYCTLCKRCNSFFYADKRDNFFNDVSTSSEGNILDTMFPEHNALKQVFDSNPRNGKSKKNMSCKFCKKNGEIPVVYQGHELKNSEGKVVCPVLRSYKCNICNATGDNAHTRKYCPNSLELLDQLPIFRRLANGIISTFHNHK